MEKSIAQLIEQLSSQVLSHPHISQGQAPARWAKGREKQTQEEEVHGYEDLPGSVRVKIRHSAGRTALLSATKARFHT